HRTPWATTPGAASGTKWLGTIMPALPKEVVSRAGSSRSMTVTSNPRLRNSKALPRPITPAPITTTCRFNQVPPVAAERSPDPPTKRVGRVQQQRSLGRHVRPAGDDGTDAPVRAGGVLRLEAASDDALLHPRAPRLELPVLRQAREHRARAGAARRAVVRFAG